MATKNKMGLGVVAVACLMVGYGSGSARGQYQVYGQGNLSCGRWTEDKRVREDAHTWVLGFVSGAGWASTESQRQTTSAGMAAWIDQYCAANPANTIQLAAGVLALELEKKR
jgi:hypothetical protein